MIGSDSRPLYLVEPEPDLDHVELVLVLVAPGAGAEVLADRQAGPVKIVEDEYRQLKMIGELELSLDALPFVADDGDVEALAHARRDQQFRDAVLLDDDQRRVAVVRTIGTGRPLGHGVGEASRSTPLVQARR